MATLRDQAKTSIPRVIRNSVSSLSGGQSNSLGKTFHPEMRQPLYFIFLDAEKEKLELEQANAVTKALSIQECPVKEKHVRHLHPPHYHRHLRILDPAEDSFG